MKPLALAVCVVGLAIGLGVIPEYTFAESSKSGEPPVYLSPLPGSELINPQTSIAFRPGEPLVADSVTPDLFTVWGTLSGNHPGATVLSDDKRTVVFKPAAPFALGERVEVQIGAGLVTVLGRQIGAQSFDFVIATHPSPQVPAALYSTPDESQAAEKAAADATAAVTNTQFLTLPADYPVMTVTVPDTATTNDYLFITPFPAAGALGTYALILDGTGQPVYYQRLSNLAFDLRRQANGLLTYVQAGTFYVMDNTYTVIDTYQAGNGYTADVHEFRLLPNGNALFMIYDPQIIDMSQVISGGVPNATVLGLVIQEMDSSKNVVFQWRSWDHFLITDTQASLTTALVDYVHGNAIELDQDGNYLVSSRHLSEITKINRQTGDIIWRMGGNRNEFTFVNDAAPYFHFQHDVRRLPNGHVTLFDNRTQLVPNYSRVAEYTLDEVNKVATLVWEYRDTPDVYALAMGSAQRQPNGNTTISWGTGGRVTEVRPDGTKTLEVLLGAPYWTYRAARSAWHGYPTTDPTLVIRTDTQSTTLAYSWNGATDVVFYRVFGGSSPQPTTLIDAQAKVGFETRTVLTNPAPGCNYYRVMPVDLQGQVTRFSNEVTNCPWSLYLPHITMQP